MSTSTTLSTPSLIGDAHPAWLELYSLSWRIAASKVEYPSAPGWKPQMCCMPDAGIVWLWDSCFMTLYARYGGGFVPVMNNLDNFYRLQREDGFIGMAYEISSEKLAYGERINPPLMAWAELNYWRLSGDDRRIPEVLPRLVRFFDWVKANRRRANGLYWFEDSGSTGMDNSPRSGYHSEYLNGSDICHVDLASQQAISAECIATLARHVGDAALAARFDEEYRSIASLVNLYHWDERSGFFYDVFNRTKPLVRHNFLNHKTIASFWPLLAGFCSPAQVEALLKHLLNPEEFWTLHPVASLSKDDPNFDPAGAYWLGGVWPPVNYMIAKGLQRSGRPDLARRLAVAHLDAMSTVYKLEDYSGIWEAYAPEALLPATKKGRMGVSEDGTTPVTRFSGDGLNAETIVRADFVGWSGLGPIAMLIEDIFGLDFDARGQRITWNVQTAGRHGVEKVSFNGGTVSLLSSGLAEGGGDISFEIATEKALTLSILVNGVPRQERQYTPGNHSFVISNR